MGRGSYHSNRAEFLSDEAILKYSRNGGCFVTTKKAIGFVVFALISLLIVILIMYYYGPTKTNETIIKESNDIEKLINDTINEEKSKETIRLPKSLYPQFYRLWIHPILDENSDRNFTFSGRVIIEINCVEDTNKIILHMDDLDISESDIQVYTTRQVEITTESQISNNPPNHNVSRREVDDVETVEETLTTTEIIQTTILEETESLLPSTTLPPDPTTNSTEPSTEKITYRTENIPLHIITVEKDDVNFKLKIHLAQVMENGKTYMVEIKFSGQILENLIGLYKTSYVDTEGNIRWLATTHLQPIYARRVFPCFDEPYFKAPFAISVARRTNLTVLSNMPLQQTEPMEDPGWVWDHFQKTPPMSTYLVAFTISDMKSISANVTVGPPVKIWAIKSDLTQAQYALDVTMELLPFLETFFDMKYPLPKLDMLAVPNFGKAAMENWGIISFRKSSLLFDPDSTSIKTRSYILAKIAHELVHQWFGNLVTMEWWSDLWLNEGLATFIAEIAITTLRPKWHAYSSVKVRDTYNTLNYDSLKSARSIQSEILTNAQIEQTFDSIVYRKGSSVLKMLNSTLSYEIFQKGLQEFVKKYAYKAVTQDHLWSLYTTSAQNKSLIPSTVTVKDLMNSWSMQSGYPYVTITRDYATGIAKINQTKMTENTNTTSDALWYIPITYITTTNSNVEIIWLENVRETTLNMTGISNGSWILLNIDETGFYRVNYDTHNWKLLIYQLRTGRIQIPVTTRGQLIDDSFALAESGIINYTIAFDLVKYLYITEPNYIPWYSALRNMEELRTIISNYEYSGMYDSFLLKLVKPMYNELGTETRVYDTQNEKLLRLHIVTSACKLRYGKCIMWARTKFYDWIQMKDPDSENPIKVDYRYIAQCTAIKSGGPFEWDFLWNRTRNPAIAPVDLQTAYQSLGCTYDPWLINRYLEYSLSGNISLEFIPYVWQSINHPVGIRTGFQFLRLNWDRIYKSYEEVYLVFNTIFHDFLGQFSTEADLEDLTTFYKIHQTDLKTVSGVLQSTVDRIKVRINWKTKHLESVVNWLKKNIY
ncbi:aminopeptidase N-like [Diorhabda carinulata]|uniref:aminopeptidase N-like n=1 Tax=Diorhabda carinulata TaxID=1163345 RepID=UPI00259FE567|nr:aminopeptidase N-like [Diorhabda carinulata]XP_057665706.1 aminopeptidase N-like [Diorhabda carinulata]XP_057665707.1 aminopeptidase N-like [Diorhabda carinulata]XP_057665708.1 aminopeptidase N-like [Diorhabda carinulata]